MTFSLFFYRIDLGFAASIFVTLCLYWNTKKTRVKRPRFTNLTSNSPALQLWFFSNLGIETEIQFRRNQSDVFRPTTGWPGRCTAIDQSGWLTHRSFVRRSRTTSCTSLSSCDWDWRSSRFLYLLRVFFFGIFSENNFKHIFFSFSLSTGFATVNWVA